MASFLRRNVKFQKEILQTCIMQSLKQRVMLPLHSYKRQPPHSGMALTYERTIPHCAHALCRESLRVRIWGMKRRGKEVSSFIIIHYSLFKGLSHYTILK